MDEFLDNFGYGLANVIDILDPDAIILGGGLSNIGSSAFDGTVQPLAIALMAYVLIAAVLILIGATSSKTENYF